MKARSIAIFALCSLAAPAAAQPPERPTEPPPAEPAPDPLSDEALIEAAGDPEVIEIIEAAPPGSAHAVTEDELERFEHDDIHKVIAAVPGVYIREEDGYGLRPNIGMRGSGSERSAKIALMEDGVLIAPAPYSAPAAYYFPLVTRMATVEVVKGPSAIRHGPNTVGGALNLVTRAIPRDAEATVDIAGGSDLYGKLHASYGDSTEHLGWLIEGVTLHSDGFKHIDGTDDDTGFQKNDVMGKLRVNTAQTARHYHQLDLKLGYADELSNETYTGLTQADFEADPYRRYAATALDRMQWDHMQAQLSHLWRAPGGWTLTTTGYRNEFSRAWRKLNGFDTDTALDAILANPTAGNNGVFYAVLTGEADSSSAAETLLIGTNDRSFTSQGVQSVGRLSRSLFGLDHELQVGLRLHHDRVHRFHFEDPYFMAGGALVRTDAERDITRDAVGSALAIAGFAQEKAAYGAWTFTAGLRAEAISTEWRDAQDPDQNDDSTHMVLIPGAGAVYQVLPTLGLLAGVHKGFVPVAPGPSADAVDPEESINYEAGFRWANRWVNTEVIGFFSDYSNLKGTCTFSSGCMDEQVGDEFNGGAVHVWGAEVLSGADIPVWQTLHVPLRASYTFNHATFQSSFSSDNPQWGEVMEGDEVPYLPEHQLQLQAAIADRAWELALAARFTSAMRNVAGQGDITDPWEQTESATVLNLAAHYDFGTWGQTYLTIDNLLDDAHVVSRRPFGARPGVPRLFIVGYKNTF